MLSENGLSWVGVDIAPAMLGQSALHRAALHCAALAAQAVPDMRSCHFYSWRSPALSFLPIFRCCQQVWL